ncbi:MAG: aminotransferase class IV [Bacteroidales bacterium]|jgi:branched-chain amino acid aminotransferase|nr:aminotransferase class IV [Bacteroidales bacterium]
MLYQYMIFDGRTEPVNSYPQERYGILYEVIRVTNGVFLFLGDHLERLQYSAKLAKVTLPPDINFKQQLEELLKINKVKSGNIKLEFSYREGKIGHYAFFFIPHRYPSEDLYSIGFRSTLFYAERQNPNAKVIQQTFIREVDRIIKEKGVYEVILVHPDGYITEGARSNFFMVDNGVVYTAPEVDVLPGITRKYVLQICHELSIPLLEKRVEVSHLNKMSAAFISGTSPKVLPVAEIDELKFDPLDPVVRKIMDRYDEMTGLKK